MAPTVSIKAPFKDLSFSYTQLSNLKTIIAKHLQNLGFKLNDVQLPNHPLLLQKILLDLNRSFNSLDNTLNVDKVVLQHFIETQNQYSRSKPKSLPGFVKNSIHKVGNIVSDREQYIRSIKKLYVENNLFRRFFANLKLKLLTAEIYKTFGTKDLDKVNRSVIKKMQKKVNLKVLQELRSQFLLQNGIYAQISEISQITNQLKHDLGNSHLATIAHKHHVLTP